MADAHTMTWLRPQARTAANYPRLRISAAAILLATAPIAKPAGKRRRKPESRRSAHVPPWYVLGAGAAVFSAAAMMSTYTVAEVAEPMPPLANLNLPDIASPAVLAVPPKREMFGLESGDVLKISIYGRDDLTAEYRVSEDGVIRIPTLGKFEAEGRSPSDLETLIRAAADQSQQRQSFVAVDVVQRQPVFVTGLVTKPGAYPITPGMAVVHATTVAGGTISTAALSTLPSEALREGARLRSSSEELNRLLVREARLTAERAGRTKVDIPARLVERAGNDEAVRLIALEQSLYDRQRESLARQQTTLEILIKENEVEIDAYTKELANIADQRRVRSASLDNVKTLAKKGLTTSQRMLDSEILMASVDREAQEIIANMARSRQNLERSRRDLELLALDRQQQVEKDLQTVDEQIVKAEAAIKGSADVINQIGQIPAEFLAADREPQFAYEVLRKSRGGELLSIEATSSTPLRPGDVVRVSARRN